MMPLLGDLRTQARREVGVHQFCQWECAERHSAVWGNIQQHPAHHLCPCPCAKPRDVGEDGSVGVLQQAKPRLQSEIMHGDQHEKNEHLLSLP